MTPLLALGAACARPDDPPRPPPTACVGASRELFPRDERLAARLDGCGALEVGFAVRGEGPLRLELFADNTQVVARVTADGAASLDALVAEGTFSVDGAAEGAGSALSLAGEPPAASGPEVDGAWAGAWARPGGGAFLTGVTSGDVPARVHLGDGAFEVTWDAGVSLAAGDQVWFDPWIAALGAPDAVWAEWADALGAGAPPLPAGVEVAGDVPVDPIRDALAPGTLLTATGWPAVPGELGDAPFDPAAWAARARRGGHLAGIVVAPFAIDPTATVARTHPEWLAGPDVLDPTDPDAVAWLTDALRGSLVGFDVVVVGGLDAVGAAGDRDGPGSDVDAIRAAVDAVRAACPDARLVTEGAPLLSMVGVADGVRLGRGAGGFDDHVAAVASALPLAGVLALDAGPVDVSDGAGAPSGRVAAAALAGPVRVAVAGPPDDVQARALDPRLASIRAVAPSAPVDGWWPRGAGPGHTVLLAPSSGGSAVDGPGGTEVWTGVTAAPGPRRLSPASGEVWVP